MFRLTRAIHRYKKLQKNIKLGTQETFNNLDVKLNILLSKNLQLNWKIDNSLFLYIKRFILIVFLYPRGPKHVLNKHRFSYTDWIYDYLLYKQGYNRMSTLKTNREEFSITLIHL